VVSCWLLIDPEPGEKPNAHNALAECLALVKYLILGAAPPTSKKGFVTRQAAAAAAPAAGCQARRVAYVVHTKEKRVVSARSTVSRLGPRSVRYSCTMSGGTMKIRLDGRVKGGLRKALGTRLHLRLVRNATAPRRGAKLKFGFSW
jgi:hypothetical protein